MVKRYSLDLTVIFSNTLQIYNLIVRLAYAILLIKSNQRVIRKSGGSMRSRHSDYRKLDLNYLKDAVTAQLLSCRTGALGLLISNRDWPRVPSEQSDRFR